MFIVSRQSFRLNKQIQYRYQIISLGKKSLLILSFHRKRKLRYQSLISSFSSNSSPNHSTNVNILSNKEEIGSYSEEHIFRNDCLRNGMLCSPCLCSFCKHRSITSFDLSSRNYLNDINYF